MFLLAFVSPAFASDTALDGKTFKGTVTESSDKSVSKDNFVFDKGTFRSTACDEYGYTAAPYKSTAKNGETQFSSTTKNTGGDTISWQGTIHGAKITGSAERKTASGKTFHMTFTGEVEHQG